MHYEPILEVYSGINHQVIPHITTNRLLKIRMHMLQFSRRAATNLPFCKQTPVLTPLLSQFLFHHKKYLHFCHVPHLMYLL